MQEFVLTYWELKSGIARLVRRSESDLSESLMSKVVKSWQILIPIPNMFKQRITESVSVWNLLAVDK